MSDKYDIRIGPNSWIVWVEPSLTDKDPFQIDELLKSTASFWGKLETQCVADCCGIEAFALWPEDVKSAAVNTEELRSHLERLRTAVLHANSQTVVSDRLNAVFDRGVFVQLIDHLLACL